MIDRSVSLKSHYRTITKGFWDEPTDQLMPYLDTASNDDDDGTMAQFMVLKMYGFTGMIQILYWYICTTKSSDIRQHHDFLDCCMVNQNVQYFANYTTGLPAIQYLYRCHSYTDLQYEYSYIYSTCTVPPAVRNIRHEYRYNTSTISEVHILRHNNLTVRLV